MNQYAQTQLTTIQERIVMEVTLCLTHNGVVVSEKGKEKIRVMLEEMRLEL